MAQRFTSLRHDAKRRSKRWGICQHSPGANTRIVTQDQEAAALEVVQAHSAGREQTTQCSELFSLQTAGAGCGSFTIVNVRPNTKEVPDKQRVKHAIEEPAAKRPKEEAACRCAIGIMARGKCSAS